MKLIQLVPVVNLFALRLLTTNEFSNYLARAYLRSTIDFEHFLLSFVAVYHSNLPSNNLHNAQVGGSGNV